MQKDVRAKSAALHRKSSKWEEPSCETRDRETAGRHLGGVCVIEGKRTF